ncbi:MAG: sugar phosphate isomerase/epimerase [Candidatus Methylacidiphilales bacterium]|nr:sugar phosphate isomerase/epimerase [Candidatus Methylacidiphilales bacterium]
MKLSQVGAQLYTCRDLLKTPADIAATLKKIRAIGYTAVQVSGMGPIAEEELVRILEGEGLTCCATHEPGADILQNTAKVIDRLSRLKCTLTAYPYPAGIDFSSLASVDALIAGLDAAGAKMAAAGQTLCYHNHNHEFRKLEGRTIFERIFAKSDPKHLQGEPDTFWVQYGGGDPVDWCERLAGRLPIIHLKDYQTNADNGHQFCEIGSGNLNFRKIIAAAEKSGCRWFVVEQDVCPGSPLDSLAQSFRYIQENLLS